MAHAELRLPETASLHPLAHVTLLANHFGESIPYAPDESQTAAYMRTKREFTAAAKQLGAMIVEDDGSYATHNAVFSFSDNTYTHDPSQAFKEERLRSLPFRVPNLRQPVTTTLFDALKNDASFENPYVLADTKDTRGYGKYLVETEEQHRKVLAYAEHRLDTALGTQQVSSFAMREFVETPTDYFTSYRVIATPKTVVAAGLLYSAHKLSDAKIMDDGSSELSDPQSAFYLAARDVRSNIALGGEVIPIVGSNPIPQMSLHREILEAHNIDPDNPALPPSITDQVPGIVHNYSRVTGIHSGLDFIGDGVYLENNQAPGLRTWEACHFGGETIDYSIAYADIYSQALQDLTVQNP